MKISKILLEWYKKNARNLPWREGKDPYRTWLSEIIFQQTRIEQGLSYYQAFTSAFPDLASLASASEQEVLRLWQGLGYYSRARNLLETAQVIQNKYKGRFPDNYKDLLRLKGVGPYTAAAIASIAFNEAVAAVDGNVIRVISRLYALDLPVDSTEGKKLIQDLANELIDTKSPGDFNEAMMDLGAMICTPRNPDCRSCPLQASCMGLEEGFPVRYPLKQKKTQVRERWLHYFHIETADHLLLKERTDADIWKGLFDFPLIECNKPCSEEDLLPELPALLGLDTATLNGIKRTSELKHQLSHQVLHIRFFSLTIPDSDLHAVQGTRLIEKAALDNYPLPVVIYNYINKVWNK